MSYSYSDIAIYDLKALTYVPAVTCWKCFCDNVFVLWEHSRDDLDNFFNFMDFIDFSKKYNLLYLEYLEFLDLALSFDVTSKQP